MLNGKLAMAMCDQTVNKNGRFSFSPPSIGQRTLGIGWTIGQRCSSVTKLETVMSLRPIPTHSNRTPTFLKILNFLNFLTIKREYVIVQEFCEFRAKCGLLWCYDWVSIPMVYTQVRLIPQLFIQLFKINFLSTFNSFFL